MPRQHLQRGAGVPVGPADRCLVAALTAMLVGCGGAALPDQVEVDLEDFGSPAGYWEGQGQASETPLDDGVRTLERSADFEFWFSLDADGNATGEIGGADLGVDGRGSGAIVQVIEMTPFSPFGSRDVATVEKRPGGPHAAHFEITEDNVAIEWSAVQQSSDVQSVEITDERRDALDALQSGAGG